MNDIKTQTEEYIQFLSTDVNYAQCLYFVQILKKYLKNMGKGDNIVGIVDPDFPEIFVRACGANPLYLFGKIAEEQPIVESFFPKISDPVVKSAINVLLEEKWNLSTKLKGILISITNDSNRKVPSFLKQEGYKVISIEKEAYYTVGAPAAYFRKQNQFLRQLILLLRKPLSKKKILENAALISKAHTLFHQLDTIELSTKMKNFIKETYYLSSDIKTWNYEVEKLCGMTLEKYDASVDLKVIGSKIYFPNYKIASILEDMGIQNYENECGVPYPYNYRNLKKMYPLWKLIRQIHQIHYQREAQSNLQGNNVRDLNSKKYPILFHLLKGQLNYAYYADKVEKECIEKNISYVCVETDITKADIEQVMIRMEAFSELLYIREKEGA